MKTTATLFSLALGLLLAALVVQRLPLSPGPAPAPAAAVRVLLAQVSCQGGSGVVEVEGRGVFLVSAARPLRLLLHPTDRVTLHRFPGVACTLSYPEPTP